MKLLLGNLKNKKVVITGGGTGLGKQIAKHFVFNGADTIIVSRKKDILMKTCDEIEGEYQNNRISYFQVDVSNMDSVNNFYEENKPNILINNAAGNFLGKTKYLSPNAFRRVYEIVALGTINMSLPLIKNHQKGDNIINISTIYAQSGSGFVIPSGMAKSAIENFTKSIICETNLRVNAVAPGSIYTKGAFSRLDPFGLFKKHLEKQIPLGRLGEPEELSNLITFLASDYGSYINGQIIRCDGGESVYRAGQMNKLNKIPNIFDRFLYKIK